jgi:hypothetical protein
VGRGLVLWRQGLLDGLRLASIGQKKQGDQKEQPDGCGYAVERAVSHETPLLVER